MIDQNQILQIKKILDAAESAIHSAKAMLENPGLIGKEGERDPREQAKTVGGVDPDGRIIIGVFDGFKMVGPDGREYSVPANYASKSKLVEGDTLKLAIGEDGSFIYKQIRPVDRKRLIGSLIQEDATGEYRVLADGKNYKVLLSSITYFKGEPGDQVVVLVPKEGSATWAAVENIMKVST